MRIALTGRIAGGELRTAAPVPDLLLLLFRLLEDDATTGATDDDACVSFRYASSSLASSSESLAAVRFGMCDDAVVAVAAALVDECLASDFAAEDCLIGAALLLLAVVDLATIGGVTLDLAGDAAVTVLPVVGFCAVGAIVADWRSERLIRQLAPQDRIGFSDFEALKQTIIVVRERRSFTFTADGARVRIQCRLVAWTVSHHPVNRVRTKIR